MVTDFEKYRKFNLRELQAAIKPEESPESKAEAAKEEPKPAVAQKQEEKTEALPKPEEEESKIEAVAPPPVAAKSEEVPAGDN